MLKSSTSAGGTDNAINPVPNAAQTHVSRQSGHGSITGNEQSSGKQSSETKKTKKQQSDKLQNVKIRIIAAVIIIDVILVVALVFQLVSLDSSLTNFLRSKVSNTFGFYNFQYSERFGFTELGQSLYQNNSNTCDALLRSDPNAVLELQRRFRYDQIWRTNEIIALVSSTGTVVASSGPSSVQGQQFDVADLIQLYMQHYAESGQPLRSSIMLDQGYYVMFDSPIFDAVYLPRPDLASWNTQQQTLARVVLTPVYCHQALPIGFLINVDSVTPRQYDYFGTLLFSTKSGMGGIVARNTVTKAWQTAFSYNHPGSYGAKTEFPDMAKDIFSSDYLHSVATAGASASTTGTFSFEGVAYLYAISACPETSIGGVRDQYGDQVSEAVYIYAEPLSPVGSTLRTAMSWQIPWIVFLVIWSMIAVRFVLRKFVEPMRTLIESVKRKRMKEFNDHLRQLKANRTLIWQLLIKVIITEAVLIGLVFANQALLNSVVSDFTSAATEGKILSYVVTSRSKSLLSYLAAWSIDSSIITSMANTTAASSLSSSFDSNRASLGVDCICLMDLDSKIIASSYAPSVGRVFPEFGVMEYLQSYDGSSDLAPFLAHSVWNNAAANVTLSGLHAGPAGAPALVNLLVAPIRKVSLNHSDVSFASGRLLGGIVIVRLLNGANSIWDIDSFTPGFFGLYIWDRYTESFRDLTSVMKDVDGLRWGVDISVGNSDLLPNGLSSLYNNDHIIVENGVVIDNTQYTASVVPLGRSDEVVLSPSPINAFIVRGISQSSWKSVESSQIALQIVNMIIVILSALCKIVLAWFPLRRFLNSLERAFTVQSISDDRAMKREHAASVMIEGKRPSSRQSSQFFTTK